MPIKQVNTSIPLDYQSQQAQIARAQQLAQALQGQALAPEQGQMVGNQYVGTTPLQGIAKLVQAFASSKALADTDKQQSNLNKQMADDRASTLARALQAREGTPAQPVWSHEDDTPIPEGQSREMTAASPGSAQKMAEILAASNDPTLSQYGVQTLLKGPEKKESPFSKVDPKDFTQDSVMRFAQTGNYADLVPVRKREVAGNGQVYDPYSVQPGQVMADPNKPFSVNPGGGVTSNDAYQNYEKQKAALGASKTTINNSLSTEKKYGETFANKVADSDVSLMESAQAAPAIAERAKRVIDLVNSNKVITGTGADFRLAAGKALGMVGLSDKETIENTERLYADLASTTLDSIKTSGLGAGQGFTNTDRDFLEKAKAGQIKLEPGSLKRMAELNYKAAVATTDKWNKRSKQIPRSAVEGTGLDVNPIQISPLNSSGGWKVIGKE